MGLITTQEDHFSRTGRALKDDFLMLQSSDTFMSTYRRWLDLVGDGMPWFQGLQRSASPVKASSSPSLTSFPNLSPGLDQAHHRAFGVDETRYHRHVVHCPATRNALKRIKLLKNLSMILATVAISVAVAPSSALSSKLFANYYFRYFGWQKWLPALVPAFPLFAVIWGFTNLLEKKFYVNYKRREWLRGKKGM